MQMCFGLIDIFRIRLRFSLTFIAFSFTYLFRVFCISAHKKANAAFGVDFQARSMFLGTAEPLARWMGQAILIWRNAPACGVAET